VPNSTKAFPLFSLKKTAKGQAIETAVAVYLQKQGLKILARNFQCKQGEIDLIAYHLGQLLFIEVRFRQNTAYGEAVATVTRSKQKKIIQCARFFLYRHPHYANAACRFDVVGVTLNPSGLDFDWIQGAFY
jgi:putative endonuclease